MNIPIVTNNRHEARVLIGLFIIMLLVETGIRLFEHHLSGNINHIFSIPSIAREINQINKGSRVLFLGNSLTNNAIDTQLIASALENSLNDSVHSTKITPDGTALSDWYCIYQNQLQPLENPPTHIVIGFAWAQLSDQYPVNATRLGGFFCDTADAVELSETGLTKHQQFLRFLAGSMSHVYVNREAIRNRILSKLIPAYQQVTQSINKEDAEPQDKEANNSKLYSYHILSRFIESVKKSGSQAIFMAMPVTKNYDLDDNLLQLMQQMNVTFIDMRSTPEISDNMFKDSIHLNKKGRSQFSKNLVEEITPYIKGQFVVKQR